MFPLKKRIIGGYKFKQRTTYSRYHLGTDWRARFEPVYAPTDGKILRTPYGTQGGQWLWFLNRFGNIHRFGHLSEIKRKGKVKEGDVIAITGNSGKYTTGPHLHEDITRAGRDVKIHDINNFIDPEIFYNNLNTMKTPYIISRLRTAIKDITGKDRKKMDTKELQEKTAKDLNKATVKWEDLELTYHELVNIHKITTTNVVEQGKTIKRQNEQIDELEEEIIKSKALAEKDAQGTKVIEALRFLYKVITTRPNGPS